MYCNSYRSILTVFVALTLSVLGVAPSKSAPAGEAPHEVWMLDQSNTYDSDGNGTLDSGGTLYIFNGANLAGQAANKAKPIVINLGGSISAAIKAATGTAPVRAHNITFNASNTHAIISFVASGHVLIVNAATRTAVFVVDVGAQAHSAVPSLDETFILVANQNGKLLQRINTNYATNTFSLDAAATINLATGTTPSGAQKQDSVLRPDNAPILALPSLDSNLAFVTLRGGGLFVVDARSTPMAIVGEYTTNTIQPAGLLAVQNSKKLYFNSGGGGGATIGFQAVLYSLDVSSFSSTPNLTPDTPAPTTIFDMAGDVDSHGLLLLKHSRYLWVTDRAANMMRVVDTATDTLTISIDLVGTVSNDPAPDLLGLAPGGNRVYVTLRGPNPLTGNNPLVNNARGSTPGLGIVRVERGGLTGALESVYRTTNVDGFGVERSDPHGVAVRY